MGSIVVGALIIAFLAVAFASLARDKKNGKSISCGGDCSHCSSNCSTKEKEEKQAK